MYKDQTRVHSLHSDELALAHDVYLSYMEQGYSAQKASRLLVRTRHERLLQCYFPLLDVTTSHLRTSRVIFKIKELQKKYHLNKDEQAYTSSKELFKHETLIEKELRKKEIDEKTARQSLQRQSVRLEKRLSKYNVNAFVSLKNNIAAVLEKDFKDIANVVYELTEPDPDRFVNKIIELTEAKLEEKKVTQTELDLGRSGKTYIDGKFFQFSKKNSTKKTWENFSHELINAGVDPEIISLLHSYYNQTAIGTGGLAFLEAPLTLHLSPHIKHRFHKEYKTHINVDKNNNITIRTDCYYLNDDSAQSSSEKNIEAKASVICQISKTGDLSRGARRFSNLKISVSRANLDIYDQTKKEIYIYHRVREIIEEIRNNRSLTADDYHVINLYLSKFKHSDGKLTNFEQLDKNSAFLLAWNNVQDAEELLVEHPELATHFFTRSPAEIKADLNLITAKHQFHPQLKLDCSIYFQTFDSIENNQWEAISKKLDGRQAPQVNVCLLSMANMNPALEITKNILIENAVPAETIEYILTVIKENPNFEKSPVDVVESVISTYLKNNGNQQTYDTDHINRSITANINKHNNEAQQRVYKLINLSKIRYKLEHFVLARFALMSERIASNLLRQSFWERFILKLKTFFGLARNSEVPSKRFKSSDLRQIIEKYPGFWRSAFARKRLNTLFGGERSYVDSLTPQDLHDLIDLKKADQDTYILNAEKILKGPLSAKVSEKISFSEFVQFKKLPIYTFASLQQPVPLKPNSEVPDRNATFWEEMHMKLSEEELYDFYQTKLEQEYEHKQGSDLLQTILNFWPNSQGFAPWRLDLRRRSEVIRELNTDPTSKLPDPVPIMQKAIINVVANNKINVFLDNFIPDAGRYQDNFSDKELKQLHKDFLSNHSILKAMMQNEKFRSVLSTHPYLFKYALKTAKVNQDSKTLFEIYRLLPTDRLLEYWQTSVESSKRDVNQDNECNYLLQNMVQSDEFFGQIVDIISRSKKLANTLWSAARREQLLILLLEQGGELLTLVTGNKDLLIKILTGISEAELAQLVSKYPSLLRQIYNISKQSQADLKKLEDALSLVRGTLSNESLVEIMALDQSLGIKIQKLQASLTCGFFKEDPAPLFEGKSQFLLQYLQKVCDAADNSLKIEFIGRVIHNNLLLGKMILPKHFQTRDDYRALNSFVQALTQVYEKTKSNEILASLKHLINSYLLMATNDHSFGKEVFFQKGLREAAIFYGDPELVTLALVQGNKLGNFTAGDFYPVFEKLTSSPAFEKYLPMLLNLINFPNWYLVSLLRGQLSVLNSRLEPCISPDKIIELMKSNSVSGNEIASALINQLKNGPENKFGLPDLRKLLLNDVTLRNHILSPLSGITPTQVLKIFEFEYSANRTILLDKILSCPLFDYLLDNLTANDMKLLVATLFGQDGAVFKRYPALINIIKKHYLEKRNFRKFILSSAEFFEPFLNKFDPMSSDYHAIILVALSGSKLSETVRDFIEMQSVTIGRRFVTNASVEHIIELILVSSAKNMDKLLLCILESGGIFKQLLSDNVNPTAQGELLLWALKIIHNSTVNEDRVKLSQFLVKNLITEFNTQNDKLYLSLPFHLLVDIYIYDRFYVEEDNNNNSRASRRISIKKTEARSLVRDYIKGNRPYKLLNYMLLNASNDQLLRLFKADKDLQNYFVNTISDGGELSQKFAERLLDETVGYDPTQLLDFILSDFDIEYQVKLLEDDPQIEQKNEIRQKIVKRLEEKPELLFGKSTKLYHYIKLFAKYESTDFLTFLANQFRRPDSSRNEFLNCFVAVLLEPTADNHALKHLLNTQISEKENLIKMMFELLGPDEVFKLCQQFPDLETKVITQMLAEPLLIEDLSANGHLLNFFRQCKQPGLFYSYILYHDKLSSKVITSLQKELMSNNALVQKIVSISLPPKKSDADNNEVKYTPEELLLNSQQLALFVNGEDSCDLKPLTNVIFSNKDLSKIMLLAAYKLTGDLPIKPDFRNLIKDYDLNTVFSYGFSIESETTITGAKKTHPHPRLKFKLSTKVVSFEQACSFIYSAYVAACMQTEYYYQFLVPMTYILHFDNEGVLRFNYVGEKPPYNKEVPLRYAMFFYDVLARLNFYDINDKAFQQKAEVPNLQCLLETKPQLRSGIISSIDIVDDKMVFRTFDPNRPLGDVPDHYRDAVLYAMCLSPDFEERLNNFPCLGSIFLKSIIMDEQGKIKFKIAPQFAVPQKYAAAIETILFKQFLYSQDADILKLLVRMPKISIALEQDLHLRNHIISAVYFNEKNEIKFASNNETVPKYYLEILLKAMNQTKGAVAMRKFWAENPQLLQEFSVFMNLEQNLNSPAGSVGRPIKKSGSSFGRFFNFFSGHQRNIAPRQTQSDQIIQLPSLSEEIRVN